MKINFSFGKKKENNESENKNISYKQKNAISYIKKDTPIYVIKIDIYEKCISIMNIIGNNIDTINFQKFSFKTRPFDEEFYERLNTILDDYLKDKPSEQARAVYIILPNECFSSELINIPTVKKKQMSDSLDVAITSSYKNKKDLFIKSLIINSNKQYSTYQVLSIKKNLVSQVFSTLATSKLFCKSATYISNSLLDSVFTLKPKNRNNSFVFVDIKHDLTYFSICYKGKTIGSYNLQYGYKILESNKYVYENMLTDHLLAEITVLNVKEKAKAKQLTTLTEETEEDGTIVQSSDNKTLDKKVPKKLPKFMQREIPNTEEGMTCENFRIFVKWILLVIDNFKKINNGIAFDYVLVNLPAKFNYVIDYINEESKDNAIEFVKFNDDINLSQEVLENLDLYGALFMNHFNKMQIL